MPRLSLHLMKNQSFISTPKKLGILGGGQLGKMLLQCTQTWDVFTRVLDPDKQASCATICHEFVQGSLMDYDTVYQFGKGCDVLTIEIEHVNVKALQQLSEEGIAVHPHPKALATIQDKGLQKMFFSSHELPTADYLLFASKQDVLDALDKGLIQFPFVQKSRTDGYDGKGVAIIQHESQLNLLLDAPCVIEVKVDLLTEIAIIAARNEKGEVVCYDPVAMDFHEGANMLDLLLYPAPIDADIATKAKQLAKKLITELGICGLLAVEFLIDKQQHIFINEVAPRPHNSGHQTIESSITSQYQQHIRGVLNLPLGNTDVILPSAMVNLLGAEGYTGDVVYEGWEDVLREKGVYLHIYGKKQTRPFRKMGHATIVDSSLENAKQKALWVKQTLQVKSQS